MSILSCKRVTEDMQFKCSVCNDTITGKNIIDGEYLYIVKINKENPQTSLFRCECCEDELSERE